MKCQVTLKPYGNLLWSWLTKLLRFQFLIGPQWLQTWKASKVPRWYVQDGNEVLANGTVLITCLLHVWGDLQKRQGHWVCVKPITLFTAWISSVLNWYVMETHPKAAQLLIGFKSELKGFASDSGRVSWNVENLMGQFCWINHRKNRACRRSILFVFFPLQVLVVHAYPLYLCWCIRRETSLQFMDTTRSDALLFFFRLPLSVVTSVICLQTSTVIRRFFLLCYIFPICL